VKNSKPVSRGWSTQNYFCTTLKNANSVCPGLSMQNYFCTTLKKAKSVYPGLTMQNYFCITKVRKISLSWFVNAKLFLHHLKTQIRFIVLMQCKSSFPEIVKCKIHLKFFISGHCSTKFAFIFVV
jgi:hypothetical protein